MGVCVGFEKQARTRLKSFVKLVAGPYVHTELIVSERDKAVCYSTYLGGHYSSMPGDELGMSDNTFDYLMLQTSQAEDDLIARTCAACAQSRIPYNTRDMVLSTIPFRCPKDSGLFQAGSLYCAQSVILVLRECLESDSDFYRAIIGINSRTITPSQLYSVLLPFALPVSHRVAMGLRCIPAKQGK